MTPAGVLHVVFASSDAVHGFLGPATRELASLGQSQSVILLDDAAARGHLPGLQRHARVVLVRGDGEGEGDGRTRHRAFYEACRREIVERRPATLHFHGLASCAIGAVALRRCAPRQRRACCAMRWSSIRRTAVARRPAAASRERRARWTGWSSPWRAP